MVNAHEHCAGAGRPCHDSSIYRKKRSGWLIMQTYAALMKIERRGKNKSGKELRSNARNPLQNKAFIQCFPRRWPLRSSPARGSWRFVAVYNEVLFTRIFLRVTRNVPCLHSASRRSSTFVTFFPTRAHMLSAAGKYGFKGVRTFELRTSYECIPG